MLQFVLQDSSGRRWLMCNDCSLILNLFSPYRDMEKQQF